MYEATFTLRQETPIIHFLHDQPGATLRATELKPKLDKFLLNDFSKLVSSQVAQRFSNTIQLLRRNIDEQKPSNYKVFISPPENEIPIYYYFETRFTYNEQTSEPANLRSNLHRPELKIVAPSPFFANNDKRKDKKWDEVRLGIFYEGDIHLTIKTWDRELHELLSQALPLLFCVENFGMRQSKGFGCFREASVTDETFTRILKNHFIFSKKIRAHRDISEIYKTIDSVYKTLRNNAGTKQSAIRDYFGEQDTPIEWEKNKVTSVLVFGEEYSEEDEVNFVRGLLGLPGLHDYPQTLEKVKVNIQDNSKDDKIERYRSPIFFKIFNGWLYLLALPVNPKMLGRRFVFFVGEQAESTDRKIVIPTPSDFKIEDFLNEKLKNWQNV